MYSSLMETFKLPSPISYIDYICVYVVSSIATKFTNVEHFFITLCFEDPLNLLEPSISTEENGHGRMSMPLHVEKISYEAIQRALTNIDLIYPSIEELD